VETTPHTSGAARLCYAPFLDQDLPDPSEPEADMQRTAAPLAGRRTAWAATRRTTEDSIATCREAKPKAVWGQVGDCEGLYDPQKLEAGNQQGSTASTHNVRWARNIQPQQRSSTPR